MNKFTGQRNAAFILVLILSISGLFAFFSLLEGHDWGGDFALYLRQAQSLLDGNSRELLEFNRYAMENSTLHTGSNPQVGPHLYPWGLPLLLVPVVALWGFALTPLKVYMIAFFLLSLWVCYRLFLPRAGIYGSLWIVALLGFSPFFVSFSNSINSDIPFLFFALLSFLFIEKSLGYRPFFINRVVTFIITGFLIWFSFLIRTNGIVLIGVLALGHLIQWFGPLKERFFAVLKQQWKLLIPYGTFIACLFLFKIWLPGGSGSHLIFLRRLTPGKLAWNIMYYTELPAEFFTGAYFPMLIYGFTIPFLILGAGRKLKEMPEFLYIVFCAATLLVFILWPPVQGLRFIFPVLPFYLYFVLEGISTAEKVLHPVPAGGRIKISWVPVFGICMLSLFVIRNTRTVFEVNEKYPQRKMAEGPYAPKSQELFSFLKKNSRKEDVIVFFKPRVLTFMTGQQSLRILKLSEIREGKGDFLIYNKEIDYGQLPQNEFSELKRQAQPLFENEQFILIDLRELPGSQSPASQ